MCEAEAAIDVRPEIKAAPGECYTREQANVTRQSENTLRVKGFAERLDFEKFVAERLASAPQQRKGEDYSDEIFE